MPSDPHSVFKGFKDWEINATLNLLDQFSHAYHVSLSFGDPLDEPFLARSMHTEIHVKTYTDVGAVVAFAQQQGMGLLHVLQMRLDTYGDVDSNKAYHERTITFAL